MEAAGPAAVCYDVDAERMTDDPSYGARYAEQA
jgi:hypothetical protein